MGRSSPSFAHDECSLEEVVRGEDGTLEGLEDPSEFADVTGDLGDAENIKQLLTAYRRRVKDCFECESCGYSLSAKQQDGTERKFNFLQYSGTRQLAEDIERMRMILDAPTMHVHGISYGTTVFSTYATIFPSSVGLFVLDSCVSPVQDTYLQSKELAVGLNQRIDFIIYSCSNSGKCPVDDMRKCIGDISSVLDDAERGFPPGENQVDFLSVLITGMFRSQSDANAICKAADDGDADELFKIHKRLETENSDVENAVGSTLAASPSNRVLQTLREADRAWLPTFDPEGATNHRLPEIFGVVYDNPDYNAIGSYTSLITVTAQDRYGTIYDEDRFARETIEINSMYTGAGTGAPGSRFFIEYAIGYYWPQAVPLPPAGSPDITGKLHECDATESLFTASNINRHRRWCSL